MVEIKNSKNFCGSATFSPNCPVQIKLVMCKALPSTFGLFADFPSYFETAQISEMQSMCKNKDAVLCQVHLHYETLKGCYLVFQIQQQSMSFE